MSFLLSPKVDFVFKRIFGNEKHPNILISFLNAVINPTDRIKSVQILNTDIDKEHIDDKYSRLDVKALTDKGEHINIEIQVRNEYNMIERSLYYWSKMFESQIIKRDNYSKLARTVCINILDFEYLDGDSFHSIYKLKEVTTNKELTDKMELHFIELPKLEDNKISDMLEAWLLFIKEPTSEMLYNSPNTAEEIKQAKEELIVLSADSKDRLIYDRRKESMLEKNSLLYSAIQAEKEGIKKGIKEGMKEGMKEGVKKGERQAKIELAKNAINNGLDNNLIQSLTGLSVSEIKELRNKTR